MSTQNLPFSHRKFTVILFALAVLLASTKAAWAGEVRAVDKVQTLEIRIEKALAEQRPRDRLNRLAEIGQAISLEEIPRALALSKELEQLRERAVLREIALKRWSELKPTAAFEYIAALPESRLKVDVVRFAAVQLANKSVQEAADAVLTMKPGRSQKDATQVLAEVWAQVDVAAALEWAENLPRGFARESALERIRFVWVHAQPVSAVDHVMALPSGDIKNALITNIAGAWAAFDPDAALFWAEELAIGVERQLAVLNAVESWADQFPDAAAGYALESKPLDLRKNAVAAVASRWAGQDPEEAIAWAVAIGDIEIRWLAASAVMTIWAPFDPGAARDWLEEIGPGPGRDRLIQLYVESVKVWAPEIAVRVAAKTEDEEQRRQQVATAIERWFELDPQGAEAWLDQSDFPDEFKIHWLSTSVDLLQR